MISKKIQKGEALKKLCAPIHRTFTMPSAELLHKVFRENRSGKFCILSAENGCMPDGFVLHSPLNRLHCRTWFGFVTNNRKKFVVSMGTRFSAGNKIAKSSCCSLIRSNPLNNKKGIWYTCTCLSPPLALRLRLPSSH